ncbi:MAG: ABC transporter ATP-binding protein [Acidaminobacteraceae bacterium]
MVTNSSVIIKINQLDKTYGSGDIKVEALKKVSFDICSGEFISIIGPSGSGKSTLMNIIGCLDKPTGGNYYLTNSKIESLSDNELAEVRNKKIGFVFQSFNLLPRVSALKNVELCMVYAGISKPERMIRAKEALEKVGLTDRMHHKPNELSGGQKQRVAIARAIVTNPDIILADEPTGNLDSHSTEEILKIFESLNKAGKTIIIVTHEDEVANRSKRILTFRDGHLVSDKEALN